MITWSTAMWTATNDSTTAGATIESLRMWADGLASMGPILVRFHANRGGFAVLRRYALNRITDHAFQGVPIDESDDYDNPNKPARIVAVMRDPRTGMESEKFVYGDAA